RPAFEVVEVAPRKAVARGPSGLLALDGLSRESLRSRLERLHVPREEPLDKASQALQDGLAGILEPQIPETFPVRVCVVGNGPLSDQVMEAVKIGGIDDAVSYRLVMPDGDDRVVYRSYDVRVPVSSHGDTIDLMNVRSLFGQYDYIICCL